MHARGKVIRDVSGRPLRVIGTSQDITRRRHAEKSLRDSEARFRTLAESANEGIVSIDSRGMIVFWNGGAQDIFGYWEDEVRGQEVQMLMPERYREDHKRGLARFLDTGEGRIVGTTVELDGLRKDGTEFPLELSLSTWLADEQRFFTGVLRDVSDRRATEQELEHVNRRQQLILNHAGEGIYGVGPDGLTQFVNPAAAAMLGYEVNELIGRALHSVIHHSRPDGSAYPNEECPIMIAMRDGTIERVGDEVFWRKDGTPVSVEYVVSPIIEDEAVTGGVVVFWEPSPRTGSISRLRSRTHPVS
jgi:PAS domain S-box-containing protein